MEHPIRRREFLKVAGAAATATAAGLAGRSETLAAQAQGAPQPADGQAEMPRFFSGCCAYSYRRYLQHGPMTMEDFIRKGVELKLDGVDMSAYYLKSTVPD
ncbi:MAG: sugar phosphate isomerase/epimerase family protein, partial [Terriglobia bacterium]